MKNDAVILMNPMWIRTIQIIEIPSKNSITGYFLAPCITEIWEDDFEEHFTFDGIEVY